MSDSGEGRFTRRKLLKAAAAGTAVALPLTYVFGGWGRILGGSSAKRASGYGPLAKDPAGLLDLPAGFRYTAFSGAGETMSDGRLVPGKHDGMAAFAGDEGVTILVRNHEMAIGPASEQGPPVPVEQRFDPGTASRQCLGGTTTLAYDTKRQALVRHHLSLAGTIRNCAGGATPWGSWITCEEAPYSAGSAEGCTVDHGWCFEVPAAHQGLIEPAPLKAMGRFNHEAAAVHEASGAVYLTEDRPDGLLYRFLPHEKAKLAAGGRLQALAVLGRPGLNTSNAGLMEKIPPQQALPVEWIDLQDVEAPRDDLRHRGSSAGAATFVRGEGIVCRGEDVFFICTSGGTIGKGQVWRYRVSPDEGTPDEAKARATLELFVEPNDGSLLDYPDNVSFSPNGDLVLCEDGGGGNGLVGVTPAGEVYRLAFHAGGPSELAGCTPSPDGTTLFVNIQNPGLTLAITGPWKNRFI